MNFRAHLFPGLFMHTLTNNAARSLCLVVIALMPTLAHSQQPKPRQPRVRQTTRSAGDLIELKSNVRLRGILESETNRSLTILVPAEALKSVDKRLFESSLALTRKEHHTSLDQVLDRLRKHVADMPDPPDPADAILFAFLRSEITHAEKQLEDIDSFSPDFLWVTLNADVIRRTEPASPADRQMLLWAWSENIPDAQNCTTTELLTLLKARHVEPIDWPLAFIKRIPAQTQTADEWIARMALVEYAFGKPLNFQGTSQALVRSGNVEPLDVATIFGDMIKGQVETQLGDLFGELLPDNAGRPQPAAPVTSPSAASLEKAIRIAESENSFGFRSTILDLTGSPTRGNVVVRFHTKREDGTWKAIFEKTEPIDALKVRPDAEALLLDDPQVKQTLELARTIGGDIDEQITRAVRYGAATMAAQQASDRAFITYESIYLETLCGPRLSVLP